MGTARGPRIGSSWRAIAACLPLAVLGCGDQVVFTASVHGEVPQDGAKLRVVLGVPGGSIAALGNDPSTDRFGRIVQLVRGPSMDATFTGAHEIATSLVLDKPTGAAARLTLLDAEGRATRLWENVPENAVLVPSDDAVLLFIPDGSGTALMRIDLRGKATAIRNVDYQVVSAAFEGMTEEGPSYVLTTGTDVHRWTPLGDELLFADSPMPLVGVAVDRSQGAIYLVASPPENTDGYIPLALLPTGLRPLSTLLPTANDLRVVGGVLRSAPTPVPSPKGRLRGEAYLQTVARDSDTLGVVDFHVVKFRRPDRSDEAPFGGASYPSSDLPLGNCMLSESPVRTPWILCDDGLRPLPAPPQGVALPALPPVYPLAARPVWFDVVQKADGTTTIDRLYADGAFVHDEAVFKPTKRYAPKLAARAGADGSVWFSDGTTTVQISEKSGSFTYAEHAATCPLYGPFAIDGHGGMVARGSTLAFATVGALSEESTAGCNYRLTPAALSGSLRDDETAIRTVKRFGRDLYVATSSTLAKVVEQGATTTTTVVLGTPGIHTFRSDGTGLPFIDDFTFDDLGGIYIYSAATRSVYYARP